MYSQSTVAAQTRQDNNYFYFILQWDWTHKQTKTDWLSTEVDKKIYNTNQY